MRAIYELKIEVDAEIHSPYAAWLATHVAEVVKAGGFSSAAVFKDSENPLVWIVHYHASASAVIDSYLKDHAPRLRADGLQRFGDRARVERRILHLESHVPHLT